MDNTAVVVIPQKRYEELIGLEQRANVLVECIYRKKTLSVDDVLWTLGTELAMELVSDVERGQDGLRLEDGVDY